MISTASPTALVAGCGDLGTEVALHLITTGEQVLGLRRRTHVLPPQVSGLSVDLTQQQPDLPDGSYRMLAVVLTADGSDQQAYRATYLDGLRHTLDALDAAGRFPERAVLVSSTGVYGDAVGEIDESSPVRPTRPTHDVLLAAEDLFHCRLPHGTVLRLSGLYGPGRSTFIRTALTGQVRPRWTNRIHRDDAAAAIVHLLTGRLAGQDDAAPALLLGTDTEPASSLDVADHIRACRDLPPLTERGDLPPGRRLSSAALRSTGFTFTHPTYREGYRAVLTGEAKRHP